MTGPNDLSFETLRGNSSKQSSLAILSLILCGTVIGLTGCSWDYQARALPEWKKGSLIPALEWSSRSSSVGSRLEAAIRERCAPLIEKGKFVGLSVVLVSGTNVAVMGFGRPSISSDEPVNENTLFGIGSITKTFTALGLAREIVRGRLYLDQKIQELLPGGLQLPPAAREVTLEQLTTHTSGFPPEPANVSFWRMAKMAFAMKNPYEDYSEAQFLDAIQHVKLESNPGTNFEYSNFGLDVLGYGLSRSAGTNYEQWVKAEVCEPMGMTDTSITLAPDQLSRFATPYMFAWRKRAELRTVAIPPWELRDYIAASGGLRSSAADMAKYLQANMHPEGPLADAIRLSHQQLFEISDRVAIAMNWMRTTRKALGTVIWHNGEIGGYQSFMGFTEDGRVGVVLLSNVADQSGEELIDHLPMDLLSDAIKADDTRTE